MSSITNKHQLKISEIFIHLIMCAFALFCILPIILILIISFMKEKEIYTTGYTFFPKALTLAAYKQIFLNPKQLLTSYSVTIITTLAGSAIGLWLTTTMGYVLSRKDYRLKKPMSFYVIFTMLFSGGIVPTYIMISAWFHMKDTYFVLILPFLCVSFNVILMRGFLQTIPDALLESAKIDGANEFRIFVQMVIPISKPAIATVSLFISFSYWNDWFQSLMFTTKYSLISLQYLLVMLMRNIDYLNTAAGQLASGNSVDVPQYSARMAMCVLAVGPMCCIFPFIQKYFSKGIMLGSVKG